MSKKAAKNTKEYEKHRDREKVKGVFHYHERPGQKLKFDFVKYGDEEQVHWELTDGQTYELPRAVARHLNNSGYRTKYEWYKDDQGMDRMRVARKQRRYTFENLDFFELEDVGHGTGAIAEVEL